MINTCLGRIFLFVLACNLVACASTSPHKFMLGDANLECNVTTAKTNAECAYRSPEVSTSPNYTLHFVELDDQGWLYPPPQSPAYTDAMGAAHSQIDRAIQDIAGRLVNKEQRVLLFVYAHGWKHSAAHDDRDVQRFRQMLSDAADSDVTSPGATTPKRAVVGIYLGWRGGGAFSASNPLVYSTFWTRKNTALHISEGSSRELFSRLRALRERANDPGPLDDLSTVRPRLRTIVIGHSFGAWIAYSALVPSLMELLAQPLDVMPPPPPEQAANAWRRARLRHVADLVLLVNPAFEASRYEPLHKLAQRINHPAKEAPVLVLITSAADQATGKLFPIGRFFNTIFQRPFSSEEQKLASQKTPGFMGEYQTHTLTHTSSEPCSGWNGADQSTPETERERKARFMKNIEAERARAREWRNASSDTAAPTNASKEWTYCGSSQLATTAQTNGPKQSPIWNIVADKEIIKDHSDIMGESLHAFLRQLYLTLP
jgi:hypothetical protein